MQRYSTHTLRCQTVGKCRPHCRRSSQQSRRYPLPRLSWSCGSCSLAAGIPLLRASQCHDSSARRHFHPVSLGGIRCRDDVPNVERSARVLPPVRPCRQFALVASFHRSGCRRLGLVSASLAREDVLSELARQCLRFSVLWFCGTQGGTQSGHKRS